MTAREGTRMMPNWLGVTISVATLALGFAPAWAQPQQQPMQRQRPQLQQPQLQQQPAPGQCTSPDRVAATGLAINPAQPRQGQAVTVSLTIQNVCNGTLANVPWRIEIGTGGGPNRVLGSGVQQNVPAGASFTVTAAWTATAGQNGLLGTADPDNTFRESNQNRLNNYRDFALNVPQVSADTSAPPGSTPQIEVRVLEHMKAKAAGANFTKTSPQPTPCGIENFGGQNPFANVSSGDTVRLYVDCGYSAFGGRGDFDLYSNFRLKNGWRIVRVDPVNIQQRGGQTDWRYDSALPAAGSDNPYMRFHLWAENGAFVDVQIKVTIQGPTGTDPYQ
jgi:hypothetical protein